ncbi:MAG: exosortase C-terminal domain/associated protein EpsI [Planctomycetota bacterium]
MNTLVRLGIVCVVFLVLWGVSYGVSAMLTPGEVILPARDFRQLPMQLGEWAGEARELDPEIKKRLAGATWLVDRNYRHPRFGKVGLHLAFFRDPAEGTLHSPMNCYSCAGWELNQESIVPIATADGREIPAKVSLWEKDRVQIQVLFWFELGDDILYDRSDLGRAWFRLAGQTQWPPLIKVLLETDASPAGPEADVRRLQEFVTALTSWTEGASNQAESGAPVADIEQESIGANTTPSN